MAFTTLPGVGKLRASILSALITELRPLSAQKTASTARTSTITRTADPDLLISAPINTDWDFQFLLLLSSAVNAAGDFSGELYYPTGASVSYGSLGLDLTLASGIVDNLTARGDNFDPTSPTSVFDFGCSATASAALVWGRLLMGNTAGNFGLNWAQNVSNANATNVRAGSILRAHRVN